MSMTFIHGLGCKSRLSRSATEILGSQIAFGTIAAAMMEILRAFVAVASGYSKVVVAVSVMWMMVLMEMVMTVVPARLTTYSTSDIRNHIL